MNLEHEFTVPVPIDEAWRVLLDVERVAPCMPGATLLSVDGRDFTGSVKVKVGPITVTYNGKASFAEVDDGAHRAVIEASGKETRGAGTAAATVTTQLEDRGSTTQVRVVTDLNVTGRPAQFGRGVMAEVGGKLVQQFATCLADELSGHHAGAAAEPAGPPAMTAAAADHSGAQGDSLGEAALDAAPPVPAKKTAAKKASPAKKAAPAKAAEPAKKAAPAKKVAAKKATPAKQTAAVEPPAGAQPPPPAPVRPITPPPRRPAEPIDLLDVAGPSVAKRLAPVLVAVVLLLLLVRRRRRRAH